MSRFARWIFDRKSALAAPDEQLVALLGAVATASGKSITPEVAMRVPAVACAVHAIADTIATLPVKTYRRLEVGGKEPDPEHPSFPLVHDDVSEWCSAFEFKRQMTVDALLRGNGYAYVNRVDGRPFELVRLDPKRMRVEMVGGEPTYLYSDGAAGQRAYPPRDVLHISALSLDGIRGKAPIELGREAIALAAVLEEHTSRLFGNGARPSGLLKFKNRLSKETVERIRSSWHSAHAGENSGRTAILEENADFLPLTFSSVDAQLLDLRRLAVEEIARSFRVPPVLLMDFGRATWSNSEEMGRQFLESLLPWLRTWESAYRRTLLAPEERKTHSIEFIVDDLLRADFATQTEGFSKLISSRVLNPNEVRAMMNRPPYEGGDEYANPKARARVLAGPLSRAPPAPLAQRLSFRRPRPPTMAPSSSWAFPPRLRRAKQGPDDRPLGDDHKVERVLARPVKMASKPKGARFRPRRHDR